MPRIFNAIRRQLLKVSRFKAYFLYAVGEIVLIVAGILIAVHLNDSNEIRKNAIKEHTVLVSLAKDFQTNLITLDSSLLAYDSYLDNIESCMNYIGLSNQEISNDMKHTIIYSAKHIHTSLVEGTLNSVLTSDKLELLENENLKAMLTKYPAYIDGFYDTQSKAEFIIMNRHRPVLEQYLSLADMLSDEDPRYRILKTKGVPSDYTGLLNSLKYQNVLLDRTNMENDLIESAKIMKLQTKKILDVLKEELAERDGAYFYENEN